MATKTVVEEYPMYDGKITLQYLPNSHMYKVDGDKKIGVTTITGVINKEALMLWPLGEAIGYLKRELLDTDDPAKGIVFTGAEVEALLEKANKAWTIKGLRGTDIGTEAHDYLEHFMIAYSKGETYPEFEKVKVPDVPEWNDDYIRATDRNHLADAIEAFKKWLAAHEIEVLATEKIIYSIEYDYAGRFDIILKIDGKTYLVDFKTSNPSREFQDGIYPENFAQLGGYDIAYTEEHPDFHIDGHAVFNLSKKTGKFALKFSEDRQINRDFFLYSLGTKRGMQHHTRQLSYKYNEKEGKKK